MPELPEVEVIRRALARQLIGARLTLLRIGPHDMRARGRGREAFSGGTRASRRSGDARWMTREELLDEARVSALHRHGKQLAIEAEDGRVLVVQLGMSGQLLLERDAHATHDRHRHVEWVVERPRGHGTSPARGTAGTRRLIFRDARRFGGLHAADSMRALRHGAWHSLGPDALTITPGRLRRVLTGTRALKALLLDQQVIAGVGNIYADEALFAAGIHPMCKSSDITPAQITRLAVTIPRILRTAIRSGGSTLRDYRSPAGTRGRAQESHAVYGRAGTPCLMCSTPLRQAIIAGRTTVWCEVCQAPPIKGGAGPPRDISEERPSEGFPRRRRPPCNDPSREGVSGCAQGFPPLP